ncbi:MAG: hypothetical protein WCW87_00470 [Candidatus Paceibacterota bacterium]
MTEIETIEITDTITSEIPLISHLDSRFDLVGGFYLTIPLDYEHRTQVSSFFTEASKDKGKRSDQCERIILPKKMLDEDFQRVSNRLEPGRTYSVQIFQVNTPTSVNDCLDFLRKNGALLVGMQGLSLVWRLKKEYFPEGKWLSSLDIERNLSTRPSYNKRVVDPHVFGRVSKIWNKQIKFHWKLNMTWFGLRLDDTDCFILVKPS